jgi:integrase
MGTEHRRGRSGKATGFKTITPVRYLIDRLESDKYRAIAALCFYGCARVNAVCHLQAIDLRNGKIHFVSRNSKTGKTHAVPILPELASILDGCDLPEHGHLFPPNGKLPNRARAKWSTVTDGNNKRRQAVVSRSVRPCLSTQAVDAAISRAVDEIIRAEDAALKDIPELEHLDSPWDAYRGFSSHSFRRSMCMYLYYTKGLPAPICMGISGHKSLDAFLQYVQASSDEAQNAFMAAFSA